MKIRVNRTVFGKFPNFYYARSVPTYAYKLPPSVNRIVGRYRLRLVCEFVRKRIFLFLCCSLFANRTRVGHDFFRFSSHAKCVPSNDEFKFYFAFFLFSSFRLFRPFFSLLFLVRFLSNFSQSASLHACFICFFLFYTDCKV